MDQGCHALYGGDLGHSGITRQFDEFAGVGGAWRRDAERHDALATYHSE
jgi:hypothetical protein